MNDQSEDVELVNRITALVREADQAFERVGGSSRHWVRDCFLPTLNQGGLVVLAAQPEARERLTCGTPGESRCEARMPNRPSQGMHGGRCGLPSGHDGDHSLLVPTQYSWAREPRPLPDGATETP